MGDLNEILTTQQMRQIETAAISSGKVTGLQLMERAGKAAADAILARWPASQDGVGTALVLCGPGNNGGDGYIIARNLAEDGWRVRVAALALPATPDARAAAAGWSGAVTGLGAGMSGAGDGVALCIDALFGIGSSRPLGQEIAGIFRGVAAAGVPLIAVDIPSGICATTGRVLGGAVLPQMDLTLTFHRPKLGNVLDMGGAIGGELVTCDIGLEPWQHSAGDCVTLAGPAAGLAKVSGHKYDYGHALVLSGGPGKCGAARLSARGALRAGAGVVTLGCPPEALPENAARLDAIMLTPVVDSGALIRVLRDPRVNALCLGPGLGAERARELVLPALRARRNVVLDADALSVFADDPDVLFADLHAGVVLTPHEGEFARLFPDLARQLQDAPLYKASPCRLDLVRIAAARCGATVLLKGAATVIATPEGGAMIACATGIQAAPWLATAGSGDVLAGIITGLLARGFTPLKAAATGAWLHAEAARQFGPGLIAEDLPERLPGVLRAIRL